MRHWNTSAKLSWGFWSIKQRTTKRNTPRSIISEMVKDTIKKTRGAAGPSVMDANRWRCILISGNFENVAEDFWKSIPEMARRLEVRSANYLAAFLACRLIPLGNFQVLDLYKLKLLRRLVTGKILSRKIPTILWWSRCRKWSSHLRSLWNFQWGWHWNGDDWCIKFF